MEIFEKDGDMKIGQVVFLLVLTAGTIWANGFMLKNFNKKDYGKAEGLSYTPKVTMLLPKDFQTSGKKYAVLYMHDGQNLFDSKKAFGGNEWRVDETLAELISQGRLPEIIVVGVHNTATRIDDYTPSFISNEFIPNGGGGKLKSYGKFLVKTLKPWVDSHFPTYTDAAHTAVMGSSLGGLASFYLAGWYPDIFGMAGAISPSFWWNSVAATNDLKSMTFKSDLYIDGGWKEGADESSMVVYMRMVRKGLIANKHFKQGRNLMFYEDPTGQHNEINWARRLSQPLEFFFGKGYQSPMEKSSLLMVPDVIGVGDESYLTLQLVHSNGLKESLPDARWTITPLDNAKIMDTPAGMKIKALKSGEVEIVTKFNGMTVSKKLVIREMSRNKIKIHISFTFPAGTRSASLEVYRNEKGKTNYTMPIDFSNPDKPILALIKDRGTGIRFRIRNGEGRLAVNLRGKEFRKNLIFRKDRESRVRVKEWK